MAYVSVTANEYQSGEAIRRAALAVRNRLWQAKPKARQAPIELPVIPVNAPRDCGRDMGCQHNRHMVDWTYHRLMQDYSHQTEEFQLPTHARGFKAPSIERIVHECSLYYFVSVEDIQSHRRSRPIVKARRMASYLATLLTGKSVAEIARRIGKRDHTSCLHGNNLMKKLLQTDADIAADVEALKAKLKPNE